MCGEVVVLFLFFLCVCVGVCARTWCGVCVYDEEKLVEAILRLRSIYEGNAYSFVHTRKRFYFLKKKE